VGDPSASESERERRRVQRPGGEPFFDRGPGYRVLSGGRDSAEVDFA
jgi:N-methylhydantoinase B